MNNVSASNVLTFFGFILILYEILVYALRFILVSLDLGRLYLNGILVVDGQLRIFT